jgi:RNA polymerase sigma-70 factor (ECF subfamily)
MARVALGDRDAFASLYDRHAASIQGFLERLSGDRQVAEDLCQETFLRAWRAAPRWVPTAKVTTWLHLIAKRLWWNRAARRRRRRPAGRPVAHDPPAPQAAVLETLARREDAARVRAALDALSPRLRLVFVLLRLQGLSLRDAARVAGVPVGTVKSRVAAAEAALRRALAPGESP